MSQNFWIQCNDNIKSTNNFILNLSSYYLNNKQDGFASGNSLDGWTSNDWVGTGAGHLGTFAVDSSNYKIGSQAAMDLFVFRVLDFWRIKYCRYCPSL